MLDNKLKRLGFIKLCLDKASKGLSPLVIEKDNFFMSHVNNIILQVIKKQNMGVTPQF